MNDLHRLVDANLNRIAEGVRVLEDVARLHFDRADLCAELRALRHDVRAVAEPIASRCLSARASDEDVGLAVSQASARRERASVAGLMAANFKRTEEGLRVVEETLKVLGHHQLATRYEALRFRAYSLEQRCAPLATADRARVALDTDLYCITAEQFSLGRDNIRVVAALLEAGVRIVQYREKEKEMGDKHRECREIRRLTREAGATFIVNDHADLALMVEADGVHLGQEDYPIEAVRALVGPEMIIGQSTHSPAQAEEAVQRGADYVGVGPLFATNTKKNVSAPVGLEYLDYAVAHLGIPFVAIGGIKVHNVAAVRQHGARCVALVTEIVGAPDIGARVAEVRAALQAGDVR